VPMISVGAFAGVAMRRFQILQEMARANTCDRLSEIEALRIETDTEVALNAALSGS